ncbi:hypothetical protein [Flavobacterium sp.]|uniref:hypothetical protein n=1 Tax=Flavobacterium sp. TaxID=239 RepID=UPI00375200B9
MKKNKRKSITLIDKLMSVRNEIKFAFLISFSSIFLIELVLKEYQSPNYTIYTIGEMYLKICYSIVATFFFFLINQHLPKENRNVKSNSYIRNKLVSASNELTWLCETLNIKEKLPEITKDIVQAACEKINPVLPVTEIKINQFNNWREYLKYKTDKVKALLNEVLILNSNIETDLLEQVLNMLDALDRFYFLDNKLVSYGENLTFYSYEIAYLIKENNKTLLLLNKKKYKVYLNTNMNDYKKA